MDKQVIHFVLRAPFMDGMIRFMVILARLGFKVEPKCLTFTIREWWTKKKAHVTWFIAYPTFCG